MIPTALHRVLTLVWLLLLPFAASYAGTPSVGQPNWPLEVLSWDLDKAYPGVEYNYRLAVRGGEYPYTFSLTAGPAGMVIDAHTGELRWTPSAEAPAQTVTVSIVDARNSSLVHSFSVAAESSAFRFVATNGQDANPGTAAAPWATLTHACNQAGPNAYIYVKAGTYPISLTIDATKCGRLLAWPGDAVTLVGQGTWAASISIRGGQRMLFQGLTFDANDHRWLFSCDAGRLENVIWRRNTMHNAYSNDRENPAFIFFWDGPQKPIQGQVQYRNIVMQENVFHDLRNPNSHGASTTLYNVQDLLYEDNTAYDIDGRGVSDKDDGFRNTFRNNIIYNCPEGIALWNQYTQGSIEINHNLIYNCNTAIILGGQPGYLRDVFVHHNTVIGSIIFTWVLQDTRSININVYRNIIAAGATRPYAITPARVDDPGGSYHYEYPAWFQTSDPKVRVDGNLLWTSATSVAGYSWGIPATTWSAWQAQGYDQEGLFTNPGLDATYTLAPSSPYRGIYGRDLAASTTPSLTYSTWRSTAFSDADLANDAISGPLADPDAAGLTNFQRYAHNLPARGPVPTPVTHGTTSAAGQTYLTLSFDRLANAPGLTYTVEASTDLITWSAVRGLSYTAGTPTRVTAQDIIPLGRAPRRFLRLRVTLP
jgi:hypothetical protein